MPSNDDHHPNTPSRIEQAARRLREAAVSGVPCQPVRDLIDAGDLAGAYAVQRLNIDAALSAGARRCGRKVGLTNPAVQRQLGVDQPDYGTILDTMVFTSGAQVPFRGLLQPRAEAEIALVLGQDLSGGQVTAEQAAAAVSGIRLAIEVVDSRIAGWDITFVDTVADNASSGLAVLGAELSPPDGLDLAAVEMTLSRNGVEESTGRGAATLGHPMNALAWLAAAADKLGDPLQAGEVVLTGALGPVVDVRAGDVVTVEFTGLGTVHAHFE
ncbi:2-keto-4-pentenoate hydratase [Phytoactinopolyspora limicola]|uniref:2-keto-4-pentenoate hydratase n=1 Tax=Phytoactinopolyspora limicola TaxID=2715536 RepID=UPI00140BC2CA|nr:fumarylacetoacetate hydrolase family protein [Phytoactinopolyspora limicola]